MPRRSAGRSRSLTQPAPARPAPAYRPPPPRQTMPAAPPPAQMAPMAQQPKQPGMMANIASTAAGVAIGSAVGHTIGHAMTGGGGGQQAPAPVAAEGQPMTQQYAPQPADPQSQGICGFEMKQFMDCAQTQHDITLCQGFNEALRQCKLQNGVAL